MLRPYARDTFTITLDQLTGMETGWTFKGDIRTAPDDGATLVASFTIDTSQVANGIVVFTIPAATMQSSFDVANPPELFFDLRARRTADGVERTLYSDSLLVQRNVTP